MNLKRLSLKVEILSTYQFSDHWQIRYVIIITQKHGSHLIDNESKSHISTVCPQQTDRPRFPLFGDKNARHQSKDASKNLNSLLTLTWVAELGSYNKLGSREIIVQYSICGPELWRIGSSGQPKQTYLAAFTIILHDEVTQSVVARLCNYSA